MALRLKQTEEKIAEYLKELNNNDANDSEEDENTKTDELEEKISQLEEKKQQYEHIQDQMKANMKKQCHQPTSVHNLKTKRRA